MGKILKLLFKYSVLLSYGGFLYVCIELAYRQRSDITMMFCGAAAFVGLGLLNEIIPWKTELWKQALIGGFCIVTPLEYLFGLLFNRDYHIWDYRGQFLNINGQICLLFSILWCFVSVIGITLDDYMRYWLFNEEKPTYKLF